MEISVQEVRAMRKKIAELEQLACVNKNAWQDAIEGDGGICPICDRFGKIYKRKLNKALAKYLLWIIKEAKSKGDVYAWVNIPDEAPRWVLRAKNINLLQHWGFIKAASKDSKKDKGRSPGDWRVTKNGLKFARGKILAPEYVYLYNNEPVKVRTKTKDIDIRQALKNGNFDFDETMSPVGEVVSE